MVTISNIVVPAERITHEEKDTEVYVCNRNVEGGAQNIGNGTLYITENKVCWEKTPGQGFDLAYPEISLHAISRDIAAFPHHCLYLMLDRSSDDEGAHGDSGSSEDEDEKVVELRFVPKDKNSIQLMFEAMSMCQNLHPDPNDSISEDEENEEEGCGDDGTVEEAVDALAENLAPISVHNGAQLNGGSGDAQMETEDGGQFEDADDNVMS